MDALSSPHVINKAKSRAAIYIALVLIALAIVIALISGMQTVSSDDLGTLTAFPP